MNMKKCTASRPMFVLRTYEDRNANLEISQNFTERLSNLHNGNQRDHKSTLSRQTSSNSNASLPPPPPPPLPIPESPSSTTTTNGTSYNTLKSNKTQKPKAPPVPEKRSTLSFNQPPPCPTPDYDTLSIASTNSMPKLNGHLRNGHTDNVEMESLESFELYSHTGNKPKPPDIYFSKTSANGSISSGTSTLRKQRPVSVTIGEYGNGTLRKPGKLNFLQNGKDEMDERKRQTITSQFASELAQTLNRSNLKRRTESMENLLNCSQIKSQNTGSVKISLSNLSKNIVKSTNDLTSSRENLSEVFANRVTININNSNEKKIDNKSGILKNSTVDNVPEHKPLVAQKSITFRELPIVINEKASQVTT